MIHKTPEHTHVTSADGVVSMEIPTLPPGVSAEDITISAVPVAQIDLAGDKSGLSVYDLQPDGLIFDEDVLVTIPFEGEPSVYFHVHDDTISPVEVVYTFSDTGNTASFPLDSFSFIYEWQNGTPIFDIEFDVGDAHVGEYLPISSKVTVVDGRLDSLGLKTYVPNGVKINASLRISGPAAPSNILEVPPPTHITDSFALQLDSDVKCIAEGEVSVTYDLIGIFDADNYRVVDGEEVRFGSIMTALSSFKIITKATCLPARPICGDNSVNQDYEECDTSAIPKKSCREHGYAYGDVKCDTNCQYDLSLCDTKMTEVSCADNTWEEDNTFTRADMRLVCADDCSEGYTCDVSSCTCVPAGGWGEDEEDEELGALPGMEDDDEEEDLGPLPGMEDDDEEMQVSVPGGAIEQDAGLGEQDDSQVEAESEETAPLEDTCDATTGEGCDDSEGSRQKYDGPPLRGYPG